MAITGTAGTSFLEATFGLHKGSRPTSRPRLVAQALYTLRPTIYGTTAPLGRLGPGLNAYINRLFLS